MSIPLKVLIVEDSEDDTLMLIKELEKGGYDPTYKRVEDSDSMQAALENETWDLVISDYSMPMFSTMAALDLLKKNEIDLPFILVSAAIGEETAISLMKAGASDYVNKRNMGRLIPTINRELLSVEERKERKRAETALRESEMKYRNLFENAPDMIHILDSAGNIIDCNKKELETLGYEKDRFLGRHFTELLGGSEKKDFWQVFEKVKKEGHVSNIERSIIAKNGRHIPVILNASVNFNSAGEFSFIQTVMRDMREIRKAQNRFDTALSTIDAMGEGIIITDGEGKINYLNQSGMSLLGLTDYEYNGDNIEDIIPGKNGSDYFKRLFGRILPLKGGWKGEFTFFNKNRKRYIQVNTMVMNTKGTEEYDTISILRDITEERERENRLILRKSVYDFDLGGVYFAESPGPAINFFNDLTQNGLEGIFISRKRPEDLETKIRFGNKSFWLAEKEGDNTFLPLPRAILDFIDGKIDSNPVILFEGMEYLISKIGYENVLRMVQELNEVFYLKKQGVMIFIIDSLAIEPEKLRLLIKELKSIKKKDNHLDKKLLEILLFQYQSESEGLVPAYSDVRKAIGVSKLTASRRIVTLKSMGFITIKKTGRQKNIYLTTKGKDYFDN